MTGTRKLVAELLDSSSDSDFETPSRPPPAFTPLVEEPLPETSQVVEPTASKATRAKRSDSTPTSNAVISTLVESKKASSSRARKPKPLETELIPPEQTKPAEKRPSKRAQTSRASKPRPTRKAAKLLDTTPVPSLATTQEGQDAVCPSSQPLVDELEYSNAAAVVDSDLVNGVLHEPVSLVQQYIEQSAAESKPLEEAMPRRTTRARTSNASTHSSTKQQGRPRKASRLHADTNIDPFANAITAARATLEDPILSDIEPPSDHNYVVAVSSRIIGNGTVHAADSTDLSPGLGVNTTAKVESLKIEQSPISGGNVTRRRTTARGRRPTAADRAPIVVDPPLSTEAMDVGDDLPLRTSDIVIQSPNHGNRQSLVPNSSLDSAQTSAQPTQCILASTADVVVSDGRRRSSRLLRLPPDEARRESNDPFADSDMAVTTPSAHVNTNDAHSEQHIGDMEYEMDGSILQQRQILGTRPMRFKAPRNARVQTFEMDDIDQEAQLEGATEANTQHDLLSTPTRRSTTFHKSQPNVESSPIPIPQALPEVAAQSTLYDRHDSPLESASIHSQHTPPRPQQGSRRVTDHLKTPRPASTPRKDRQTSAGYLPDVPHSPSRVATPHRVIYSPQHPMTHFKPAIVRASHGGDIVSAISSIAQPGSTPGAKSSRIRISEPFRPSLPAAPLLRLSNGSDTGRMSTSGGDASGELDIEETRVPFLPARRYVQKGHILAACGQTAPLDWVSGGLQACGVLLPELDAAQLSDAQMGDMESESGLCKIGEATYSEVFSAQWRYVPRTRYDNFNSKKGKVKGERLMQVALKVIPFGNSAVKSGTGEPQTTLRDLYQEIGATLALSRLSERERAKLQEARMQVKKPLKPKERELGANFVKAFRVCICQGPLPAPLLRAWD
ncbi:hypothetical protein GGI09_007820, partial [Coemansia sp. S100]